jgi:hypothetical protein
MKTVQSILLGLLTAAFAHGQGTVVFNNNASTHYNIFTNNASFTSTGPISGANAYRIGLYAAPGTGASESSLNLVGLATNAPLPGKFNGGGSFALPNGYAPGAMITFQIRIWSFQGGLSYADAVAAASANPLNVIVGSSAVGTTTLGGASPNGPLPAGALFGTAPGQIGGFVFPVPEPSGIALSVLGTIALLMARRRT